MPYVVGAVKEMSFKVAFLPTLTDQTFITRLQEFLRAIAEQGAAIMDTVRAKRLCAEDVCVDKVQLKQMIDFINTHGDSTPPVDTSGGDQTTPVLDNTTPQDVPPTTEPQEGQGASPEQPVSDTGAQSENSGTLQ